YANVDKMPKYLSDVTLDVSTENFYWVSRLLGALADPNYGTSIQFIERYQNAVPAKGRALVNEYDRRFMETQDPALLREANEKLAAMAKKETTETLNKVLLDASKNMRCGYSRADN
ncbi:MAG: C69 family dipeptidase, partial [Solobacterium sp.]|nr:C69 family dipeptidase [Solobacterium sp.]